MKKYILLCICLCTYAMALAQESNTETYSLTYTVDTLQSKVLKDDRALKVYLPEGYDAQQKYPVVYITDAQTSNFTTAMTYMHAMMEGALLPKCILVGIVQKDRWNELEVSYKENGKRFKDYIFEEVVPYIDAQYSTSGYNVMVGHSDGAEYNQHLLLEKENPFASFISCSTNFNTPMEEALGTFFKEYTGKPIYYFIANVKYEVPERIAAGNLMERLAVEAANPKIQLTLQTYKAQHESIVIRALQDGLLYVFQNYRNLDAYADFKEYADHYQQDIATYYGFVPQFEYMDVDYYFGKILDEKDIAGYEFMVQFSNQHNIFFGNYVDEANSYFYMEAYPQTIVSYNRALNDMEGIQKNVFMGNLFRVLKAYEHENDLKGAVKFMEASIKKLPEYKLELSYLLGKFCKEQHIQEAKGKRLWAYCKKNYHENRAFTQADLEAL
ncbi:Enterochelin esterase [Pustulibacterium marinum]|uniref:Enterochelin esterase n=1 Tax=Pustulibacterium marinum TaxID=1224947 RepID=A0A1I7FV26_9FLAO|nr:alpha/beta hydrolase-fold protein [Pustulibacterium marinum]SFU40064.1 Enterochelin esterase [Pustulibacterium marinum]